MKGFAALAALTAVAVAVGIYLGTRDGAPAAGVPTAYRNSVLDAATRQRVIPGYRADKAPGMFGKVSWHVAHADITVENPNACPMCAGGGMRIPILWIEYSAGSRSVAERLLRFARTRWRGKIEAFETTTLDSHTPDARIMLIPKAGA